MMQRINLSDDCDDGVYQYRFTGQGRLILDTMHGQVVIDIRCNDVNAFVLENGKRTDHVLVKSSPSIQETLCRTSK